MCNELNTQNVLAQARLLLEVTAVYYPKVS